MPVINTQYPTRERQIASSPLPAFGFAGSCRSALEVGGDFCEVLRLSDESVLLVIADVMGKGPAAALMAGTLQTLTRALVNPGLQPAECLFELNQIMFEQLSTADMFVTAQLVVVDLQRRRLQVASAGHCPLLISDGRNPTELVGPGGIPLGIESDAIFEQCEIQLAPFSAVLLYTDGVTEARNRAGRFFGQHRLEEWFRHGVKEHGCATELKGNLLRELADFQGSGPLADDQTFLILADESPRLATPSNLRNLLWMFPWQAKGLPGGPVLTNS